MGWRERRIVLIGQAPNKTMKKPEHALTGGRTGNFIARELCGGIGLAEYVRVFERRNLLSRWPGSNGKGDAFPIEEARRAAAGMVRELRGRRVILFGRGVATAFALEEIPLLRWTVEHDAEFATCPHPSGVNTWWNERANRAKARAFFLSAIADWRSLRSLEASFVGSPRWEALRRG